MKIFLRFSAVLSLSLAVLLFEPKILFATILSAFLHEIAHIVVIRLSGGQVYALEILSGGCVIRRSPDSTGFASDLAVFAAGPLANLMLWGIFFPFSGFFAPLSRVSLSLAVFNLLPIRSQDGGRILKLLACRFLPPAAASLTAEIFSLLSLGVLWIFGIRMLLFYDFSCVYFWFCLGAFYVFYVKSTFGNGT